MSVAYAVPIFAVATFTCLAATDKARADMLVLELTETHYRPGDRVPGDKIDVKEPGAYVKVLVLDSKTTKIFESPDRGTGSVPFGGTRGFKRKSQQ